MATERIIEHLDRLREKPEHVRHRYALLVAGGVTSLVALGWMTALATSGALALKDDPQPAAAASAPTFADEIREPASAFSELLGAAGAALGATSSEAALTIIQTRASSTLDSRSKPANDTDKTVIPF
jgi:hypothetical protein